MTMHEENLTERGEALFTQHRTTSHFSARPIEPSLLHRLYDLVKLGPTSGNCCPARFIFVQSEAEKQRLKSAVSVGNKQFIDAAPVIAIMAYDPLFFEELPRLNNIPNLRDWFAADMGLSEETALRNATLQGGYFILAARLLGLGCRPLSGFDSPMVEEMFLKKYGWRANFLIALGYEASCENMEQRAPRLDFESACRSV